MSARYAYLDIGEIVAADADGFPTGTCIAVMSGALPDRESERIGTLLAAAPDLYAALEALDKFWLEDWAPPGEVDEPRLLSESTLAIWRQVRAALSRASLVQTRGGVMATLSPAATRTMTLGSLRRQARNLREACSAYDLETDRLKREAERASAPCDASRNRIAVDAARAPSFANLRAKLHAVEAQIASWRPAVRKVNTASFGAMIRSKVARP